MYVFIYISSPKLIWSTKAQIMDFLKKTCSQLYLGVLTEKVHQTDKKVHMDFR